MRLSTIAVLFVLLNSCAEAICVDVGSFTFLAGDAAERATSDGDRDGTGLSARFDSVFGCAVDGNGDVFATEPDSGLLRRVNPYTGAATTYLGVKRDHTSSQAGGPADADPAAAFYHPHGLAMSRSGTTAYLVVTLSCQIMRVDTVTRQAALWVGGSGGFCGLNDGIGTSAEFAHPAYITLNGDDSRAWVSEPHRVRHIAVPTARVSHFSGDLSGALGDTLGTRIVSQYNYVRGIEFVAARDMVFLVDGENLKIKKCGMDGTSYFVAGAGGSPGWVDGVGATAEFTSPYGTALHPSGRHLFVAEASGGNRVRRVDTDTNEVVTVLGQAGADAWQSSSQSSCNGQARLPMDLCVPRCVSSSRGRSNRLYVTGFFAVGYLELDGVGDGDVPVCSASHSGAAATPAPASGADDSNNDDDAHADEDSGAPRQEAVIGTLLVPVLLLLLLAAT
jgi:DNA-binding beta-propeller fold protein YncE